MTALDNIPWKGHAVAMHSVGSTLRRRSAQLLVGPAALALAAFGGSALASPASAAVPAATGAGYGPNGCTIMLSVTVVNDGATITASGNCGKQGDTLTFTFNSTPVVLGSTSAGVNGAYSVPETIPSSAPLGQHSITVTDTSQTPNLSATAALSVVAPGSNGTSNGGTAGSSGVGSSSPSSPSSGGSSGGLAFTGTDTLATTAVGAGALGLGGILLLSSRKRRRNSFSS